MKSVVQVLAMICRSDGAYRDFFRSNNKDLAPPELPWPWKWPDSRGAQERVPIGFAKHR
jgi:hypothetical protein